VPCALLSGFSATRYSKNFLCDEHRNRQLELEKAADIAEQGDVSRGKEALPIALSLLSTNPTGGRVVCM